MPRIVSFHYTLRAPDGRVLDTSAGSDPVTYLEGAGQIIDGLDQRLRDVAAGTKSRVEVPAPQAYGARDPAQIQRVKRAQLPIEGELNVGDQFQTGPHRADPVVTVAALEGEDVLLDANHPLAGMDLTFDVEVVAAREATAEEIAQAHAHAAGNGCCGGGCG